MAIKRRLSSPVIDEVSLVDKGANLKKFIFIKNQKETTDPSTCTFNKVDADIKIESNGTVEGTTISINGEEINPVDFTFSLFNDPEDVFWNDVFCNYSLIEVNEKGEFSNTTHYRLQKDLTEAEDNQESLDTIKKSASIIQEYLTEEKLDHLGEDGVVDLAKSLDILADYKTLVPPDVLEAITNLTDIAVRKTEKQENFNKEKEKEMTEENKKKEETTETPETKETPEVKEVQATPETKETLETKESSENIVLSKPELENLVAKITQEVTASVTTQFSALEEKLKPEDEKETEVSLEDIADMVEDAVNA